MTDSSEKTVLDEKKPGAGFSAMPQDEDSQDLDTVLLTSNHALLASEAEGHVDLPAAGSPLAAKLPTREPATTASLVPTPQQETDAWWGSYSGWTMMPSMVLCIGLSGLIAWGSWQWLDRGLVQISILTLTAAVWLTQVIRWSYRVFGYNYRLTTQRLFQDKGWFLSDRIEVDLAKVANVFWRRSFHHILTKIGTVGVLLEGSARRKIVLEGVWQPRQVAELIKQLSENARERQVVGTTV